MLTKKELASLSEISTSKTLLYLLADYLLLSLCFFAVNYFDSTWVYLIAFIIIARTQLALAILMHDASHRRLSESRSTNDFIGQFLVAAPLFFSMFSYQKYHLKHHRIPMETDDPDISLTGGYPIAKQSFLRKIFRDISGVSYFKFIGYFIYRARRNQNSNTKKSSEHSRLESYQRATIVFSIVLANLFIFMIFYFLGNPSFYLLFWFLPMVTLLQLLLRVRGITEHAGYLPVKSNNLADQAHLSRTIVNPIQTFFFAPHNVHYHIEHHVYPGIPHYNLAKVHKLLSERDSLPKKNIYDGYGKVLRELIH
jgi:fatty acid desaturase